MKAQAFLVQHILALNKRPKVINFKLHKTKMRMAGLHGKKCLRRADRTGTPVYITNLARNTTEFSGMSVFVLIFYLIQNDKKNSSLYMQSPL